MHNTLLVLLTLQAICALCSQPDLAIVVARHGARGPTTQTYSALSDWHGEHEQLTELGAKMHYDLGSRCREKYLHLLEPYDAEKVIIRSSNVLRTHESAYSFLLGAYNYSQPVLNSVSDVYTTTSASDKESREDEARHSDSFHFFTPSIDIPIQVVESAQDKLLQGTNTTCFVSSRWFKDNEESEAAHTFFNVHMNDFIQHLESKDIHIDGMQGLYEFCDLAIANSFGNLSIPGDIERESELHDDIFFCSQWIIMNRYAGQDIQKQLGAVNLLDNVLSTMQKAVRGESPTKFIFYATHDSNLAPLLAALGIVDTNCLLENHLARRRGEISAHSSCLFPIFASDIRFELYNNGEQPYVKVHYKDEPVEICGGLTDCPLSAFRDYVASITNGFTVDSYDFICNAVEDF